MPIEDARVFFCNSGAEANEALLKLVRKHGLRAGRPAIVALDGSFHGRTVATLAATGQPAKRAPFEPLVDWFRFVPPGDLAALDEALAPGDVGAVFLEPVLGEGGVVPLSTGYLRGVRAIDATRPARCWRWTRSRPAPAASASGSSISLAGVRPDVASLAKALGGGLPIGALVARADLSFEPGEHASTFGGGPVPCAAALSVLDVIERDGLLTEVRTMGAAPAPRGRAAGAGGIAARHPRPRPADRVRGRRGSRRDDRRPRAARAGCAGVHGRARRRPVHAAAFTIDAGEVDVAAKAMAEALAEAAA